MINGVMPVYFIVNPAAGNGRGRQKFAAFSRKLPIPHEVHYTTHAGHALELAKAIREKEPAGALVVAVGGDGTVHEVLNAVVDSRMIAGVINIGSGNDYKRYFPQFDTPEQLVQFVRRPERTAADMGAMWTNGQRRHFINNSGIGFDAFVCRLLNGSPIKRAFNRIGLGKLAYVYTMIAALTSYRPIDLAITVDGRQRVYRDVWFFTASNQPFFGGGMKIAPRAKAEDGRLDFTVVHRLSRLKLLLMFITVYWGGHTRLKEVEQFQAAGCTVTPFRSCSGHHDGEVYDISAQTPLVYEALPNVIQLARTSSAQ